MITKFALMLLSRDVIDLVDLLFERLEELPLPKCLLLLLLLLALGLFFVVFYVVHEFWEFELF